MFFLHGLGQTAKDWDKVISLLPDYDCLALELFDQGRLPDSIAVMEQKVRKELATINEDVIVIGLSLGASLAYTLLNHPPTNLKGIVACAGQYDLQGNPFYHLQKLVFRLLPASVFAKQGLDKKSLIPFYKALGKLDLSEVLACTETPCAIVCGDKDKVNLKTSRKSAQLIPNATYHLLPNAGHLLTDDAPEELVGVIRAFIKKSTISQKS